MTKLTEDMVVARSRGAELKNIKKLNCWGSELSDISVIRKMPAVEVLSLSVNTISTLSDFQNCSNLQELYIRKNNIKNLWEICYLKDLPKLRNLWLEENPCADFENYRMTVIRNLPHLKKLDNTDVKPEEVQQAMIQGVELVHPMEHGDGYSDNYEGGGYVQHQLSVTNQRRLSQSSLPDSSRQVTEPPSRRGSQYSRYDDVESRRYSQPIQQVYGSSRAVSAYARPQRSSWQEGSSQPYVNPNYDSPQLQQMSLNDDDGPMRSAPSTEESSHMYNRNGSYPSSQEQLYYREGYHSGGPVYQEERRSSPPYEYRSPSDEFESRQYEQRFDNDPQPGSSDDCQQIVGQHYENTYRQVNQQIATSARLGERTSPSRPFPGRPRTRSSNILSAVLCLVKELDYPGLEVAEMAIRCRMQELDD